MLTTVAALVIVLGLMVSLARYERRRSAENFTREAILAKLEALLSRPEVVQNKALQEALADPQVVPRLVRPSAREPEELVLQLNARKNNEEFVKTFKRFIGPRPSTGISSRRPIGWMAHWIAWGCSPIAPRRWRVRSLSQCS